MDMGLGFSSPPISDSACWTLLQYSIQKQIISTDDQDFQKSLVISNGLGLSMGSEMKLPRITKQ